MILIGLKKNLWVKNASTFLQKAFFWEKKKKKRQPVPKEYFDETADSRKSCCIEKMSSTSILGLIQAI